MNTLIKITTNLLICLLFVTLTNCEENIVYIEAQQTKTINKIDFHQFISNINTDENYSTIAQYFDFNTSNQTTRIDSTSQPTILTDQIMIVTKPDYTTYTFMIDTNSEEENFYNLVVYVDANLQIYNDYILEYAPSDNWLADTSQMFDGQVRLINNSLLDTSQLFNTRMSGDCVTGVHTYWECNYGNPHSPGTCQGTSFTYTLTLEYGPCPNTSEGWASTNTGGGSSNGLGGSSNNNEDDDTVVTSILTAGGSKGVPDNTDDDCLATQQLASLTNSLNLDPVLVSCLENPDRCTQVSELFNYLQSNPNQTDFATVAAQAICDDGEVDFEEQVIYDDSIMNYPCQKAIIEDITLICQPLSELFQTIFIDSDETKLIFKAVDLPILNGGYTLPIGNSGFNYIIGLNTNRLTQSTNLDIISTVVHEYTHATLLYFFYNNPSFSIDLNNPPSYANLVQMFSLHREQIGTTNDTQHAYMVQLVDDMAQVCYSYCQQNNISITLEQITKICWGGLEGTATFDQLFPDLSPAPSPERDEILNAVQSEIFPNDPGENPLGTQPCN